MMQSKKVLQTGVHWWFSAATSVISRAFVNKAPIGSLSTSAINSHNTKPGCTINTHHCCSPLNGCFTSHSNSYCASLLGGKRHYVQGLRQPTQQSKGLHTSRGDLTMSQPNVAKDSPVLFRQLFEHKSYTYSYLLACMRTKQAIIIDPVLEMVPRDVRIVEQLSLTLKHAINTHVHADHITGSGKLKQKLPGATSMLGESSGAKADSYLQHGQKVQVGDIELEARKTPGHTDGCMTYVWHDQKCVFTGDAILIRGCGRTDFQQGSAERLYSSVHSQIFSLPEDYVIYPAHDYTGQPWTTVGEEKKYNPRLTKTKEEFIELMNNLNLPYPKQIDRALPANLICGVVDEETLDANK